MCCLNLKTIARKMVDLKTFNIPFLKVCTHNDSLARLLNGFSEFDVKYCISKLPRMNVKIKILILAVFVVFSFCFVRTNSP